MERRDLPSACDAAQPDIDRRSAGTGRPAKRPPLSTDHQHARSIWQETAVLGVDHSKLRLVPRSQQARSLTDQRRILTERSHPTGRRIGSRAPCRPRTDRLDQANSPQLDLRLDIAGVGLPRRDARK
jgi:hypothetical protein